MGLGGNLGLEGANHGRAIVAAGLKRLGQSDMLAMSRGQRRVEKAFLLKRLRILKEELLQGCAAGLVQPRMNETVQGAPPSQPGPALCGNPIPRDALYSIISAILQDSE